MALLFRAYYGVHNFLFGLLAKLDGLAPLLIRLYLAPVMIAAGLYKFRHLDATAQWLGSGLGLPEPELLAHLLTYTELLGGFLLLFGLAVRWVSIPLMVAMLVAAITVHWDNGWFAIAPADPVTSTAKPLADLGLPAARASLENSQAVGDRLDRAADILNEHGNYGWLTEKGDIAVLNNGIEFAATYFIMLFSLLFSGGGRWFSADYYLDRQARARIKASNVARAEAKRLADEPVPVITPSPAPVAAAEISPAEPIPVPATPTSMPDPQPKAVSETPVTIPPIDLQHKAQVESRGAPQEDPQMAKVPDTQVPIK